MVVYGLGKNKNGRSRKQRCVKNKYITVINNNFHMTIICHKCSAVYLFPSFVFGIGKVSITNNYFSRNFLSVARKLIGFRGVQDKFLYLGGV